MEASASAGPMASAVLDRRRWWWALALLCGAFSAALAEGYQSAFLACAVLTGIGLALAFLLPADRESQRTSCQSRTRRPMPLPQETW